ncbi:MAG: hypothetical protein WBD99_09640 [Thermodesulfobacteriota bacterium]
MKRLAFIVSFLLVMSIAGVANAQYTINDVYWDKARGEWMVDVEPWPQQPVIIVPNYTYNVFVPAPQYILPDTFEVIIQEPVFDEKLLRGLMLDLPY